MKRRDFLKTALVGSTGVAASSLTGCSRPASEGGTLSGPSVRWRMASSFPAKLDTIYGAAEVLAEKVSAMTDGHFEIRVHEAGELVPALEVMDAVQQGSIQASHTASYYFKGKNPALAFDTCVPFGMTARQQNAWLLEGGGLELIHRLYADFNIISFPGGNTGAQMGGWFRKEVSGPDDLVGLRMRIPGLGGDVMNALGVSVQVIPGAEVYTALEKNTIDACEWVGPYDDERFGFHKVADFYYYPGWWEPGPSLTYQVNIEAWEALPDFYKAVFRAACKESAQTMQTRYDARNPPALQRILANTDYPTTMKPFSRGLMRRAHEATKDILSTAATQDPAYAELYAHWDAFRRDSFAWFKRAELAYQSFAFNAE